MHTRELRIETGSREQVRDLTVECRAFLHEVGAGDGLLHVWMPHATAGLAVIETGAGSDTDLLALLGELLPADGRWRHQHGSRGTAGTTCCPPCWRPTPASRCSAGNSRWVPGSRSAWWTPMATTQSVLSG